ncbi:hypothetical protein HK104_003541 [Borealophlyctis nickersoniae]|nr:hypothetical protein HK104_003541 [Borealophlyctis nickersoniae]
MHLIAGTATRSLYLLASLVALSPAVKAATCYSTLSKSDFAHCQLLDPRYALHWNVKDGEVTFGATVDVDKAWIALGISDNGGMNGADITVIQDRNGKLVARDYWAETFGLPELDKNQNVEIDSSKSSRGNGVTTAVWKRPLTTCDSQDQPIVENVTHAVIWAIGSSDEFGKHEDKNRGDAKIAFIPDTKSVKPEDPKDLALLEMYFNNYAVPTNKSTSYTCIHTSFAPPTQPQGSGSNTTSKFHVIRYEGVAKSEQVHHMIIYGCYSRPKDFNQTYDCVSMEPDCSTFLFGWAPGQGPVDVNPEAGFAIGSAADAFQYFSLQIHYTNPHSKPVTDSSGFKLYYTSQLRKNDMGVMFLGTEDIRIPGNTALVTAPRGECPSNCTRRLPHPIMLNGNFFHMHTLGKNITTQHIRDGKELEPIGVRGHYDFNHQGGTAPNGGVRQILPGDAFITTCSYDSIGRDNVTTYGESTSDEMCFNIIQYYPRVSEIDYCVGGGGGYSTCASLNRLGQMSAELQQKNATAEEGLNALIGAGLLVKADIGNFTPYDAQCTPSKANQNSGGVVALAPRAAGLIVLASVISFMFVVA